ncbi:hypothetical protein QZH41_011227, partial [Actinostola sp. cb2023]
MMSQEELLPWSEPDTNFFADNLLGIEDWGDSITDIKISEDDVVVGNKDQDMDVNTDDLSELLQNIGDDMWAISEDTILSLGAQIKQEPPSPSSSTSSLISLDSSLPSSPESQLLTNGQCSPPHQPTIEAVIPYQSFKTHLPTTRIRTDLILPLSDKTSAIKTEFAVTPSCMIKQEPITIQPCSLVQPFPNLPVGHVQKITIQNGQQPKLIQQGKGVVTSTTGNITYIPVTGTIPTTAIFVGVKKAGLPISKPITSVIPNVVSSVKSPQSSVINEKVVRRQQRMIKNRESACLSRKKKKEYLQSLECKVKDVTYLNDRLNEENMKLKHKVTELKKENLLLKSNHHPANWSSTAKKSTCVLAVVLFVALNVGSFRLNEALGDWIHKYQVEEKTSRTKKQTVQENKFKSVQELALRLTPNCTETEARRTRIQRHMFTRRHNTQPSTTSSKNAIQLFKGPDWLKVFSDAINRQDDTMYIVSFRQDHLIFPATKGNVTQRPKVSLMMMAPSN